MRLGVAIVATFLAAAATASAQSDRELATRQELISQATALRTQGNHTDALAIAKRAAAIKLTPSLRLFLAGEQVALSLLADAYGNGRQCRVEAEVDLQLHNRDRILAECRALEEMLSKRVARVTVLVPAPAPSSMHVTLAGDELNPALFGEAYVVSPGKLAIRADALGFLPFSREVELSEGGTERIEIHLDPDPRAQPCGAAEERVHELCVATCPAAKQRTIDEAALCCWPGQTSNPLTHACEGAPQCADGLTASGFECITAPPATLPAATPVPSTGHRSSQRVWALGVGGGGAAGVALGTALGIAAVAAKSSAHDECRTGVGCSQKAANDQGSAITLANASTVAFVAGGALLATGLVLYLTAPKEPARRVGIWIAPGSAGFGGGF